MMIPQIILWAIGTYLIASIPFSVLIGCMIFKVDIRDYGDGNPGATNVKQASGSLLWMLIAVILDSLKGMLPVGIPLWLMGWTAWEVIPIAMAAVTGHAFSIFLRFRGGKAVATSVGIWVGLISIEAILLIPTMLTYAYYSVKESEWAVIFMMVSVLLYLILTRPTNYPFLLMWLGNMLIIGYRHRMGLHEPPTIQRWLPLLNKGERLAA